MLLYVAICDDEIFYLDKIKQLIEDYIKKEKILIKLKIYSNSEDLIEEVEQKKYFDIYFLDIVMPEASGLKVAERIRAHSPHAIIILISNFDKYAIQAFELSIFRYIQKKTLDLHFQKTFEAAIKLWYEHQDCCYIISTAKMFQKIKYKDIIYIYKSQKYSVFVLRNGESKIRKTLTDVFNELNSPIFLFVDRCYIINLEHVQKVNKNGLILNNGHSLLMSRKHLEHIKNQLDLFWNPDSLTDIKAP